MNGWPRLEAVNGQTFWRTHFSTLMMLGSVSAGPMSNILSESARRAPGANQTARMTTPKHCFLNLRVYFLRQIIFLPPKSWQPKRDRSSWSEYRQLLHFQDWGSVECMRQPRLRCWAMDGSSWSFSGHAISGDRVDNPRRVFFCLLYSLEFCQLVLPDLMDACVRFR